MQYSTRSLFWWVTGAGIVAFSATISHQFALLIWALVVTVGVSIATRANGVRCAILSSLAGGVSLWVGLFFLAFPIPWQMVRLPATEQAPLSSYQQFVRDTFWTQSLFVFMLGVGAGAASAALVWLREQTRGGSGDASETNTVNRNADQ